MVKLLDQTISPELDKTGYRLRLTCGKTLWDQLHAHTYYDLLVVASGECRHEYNGTVYTFRKNEAMLMRPGDTHRYLSQTEGINLLALSVVGVEMQLFLNAYDLSVHQLPTEPDPLPEETLRQMLALYDRANIDEDSSRRCCKLILGTYMHHLLRRNPIALHKPMPLSLAAALERITDLSMLRQGVPALEEMSGYSRPQLVRLMKAHTGKTPQQYILELRLSAAWELVCAGKLSSEEIADKIGYSSVSHFNKLFRQRYHETPAALARRMARIM